MPEPPVLAVDLGGTRMRAAAVDSGGAVADRREQPTPRDAECPDALAELAAGVVEAHAIRRAVIGVPGTVDYRAGRLEHAPNLPPHWPVTLTEEALAGRLGVTVTLANDADLAAVGEAYAGAGRGADDVVYLTVSTGVGAGVLLGRRLVRGRRSLAEVGHTVVDWRADRAGDPATLEELGSGTALERAAADAGLPADGRKVTELAAAGDGAARRVWDELTSVVAAGVANLAYLFAPERVVLGGGVGQAGELLLAPLREHLARRGPPERETPELHAAALGDDAGLAGAAAWDEACGEERP
jgi:glucokinase